VMVIKCFGAGARFTQEPCTHVPGGVALTASAPTNPFTVRGIGTSSTSCKAPHTAHVMGDRSMSTAPVAGRRLDPNE